MAAPRPILVGFRVKYWTEWGQNLVVVGNHPKLGEWDVRKGVWMHCQVRARGCSNLVRIDQACLPLLEFIVFVTGV